jgi:hypothetical protein
MNQHSRRAFIKRLGMSACLLPFTGLSSLSAQSTPTIPKRLVIFSHPNGTIPSAWFPTIDQNQQIQFGQIHNALIPFQNHIVFTNGIDLRSAERGPGEPHQKGMGCVLTGNHLQEGNFIGGDGSLAGWGNQISLDQMIAQSYQMQTRFASLELGVRVRGNEVRHRISYQGPAQPLSPTENPFDVYQRVFGSLQQQGVPSSTEQARQMLKRRSILDHVWQEYGSLRTKVASEDRTRLEQHAQMLRDLELRLSMENTLQCMIPSPIDSIDINNGNLMEIQTRRHIDLITAAFACDQTRVVTLQMSSGANNISFPFLNTAYDDHALSHSGMSAITEQNEWIRRQAWYSTQFAYLLEKLASVTEADGGTLLDHTLVLWVSDLAVGNTHSHDNMPFVLAGGAGVGLQGNRYLQFNHAYHNELLLSIARQFGLALNTFGDPDYCRQPLDIFSI